MPFDPKTDAPPSALFFLLLIQPAIGNTEVILRLAMHLGLSPTRVLPARQARNNGPVRGTGTYSMMEAASLKPRVGGRTDTCI